LAFKNLFNMVGYIFVYILRMPFLNIRNHEFGELAKFLLFGPVIIAIIVFIGIFDSIILMLSGLIFSSEYHNDIMENPSRPPRVFGSGGLLIPYDYDSSLCQYLVEKHQLRKISTEKIEHYQRFNLPVSRFYCFDSVPNKSLISYISNYYPYFLYF
jgi:hypothetical protein